MTEQELAKRPKLKKLVDEAQVLCLAGEWERVIPKLQHLQRLGYAPAVVQQALGTAKMNLGQATDAIVHYGEAIRRNPDLISAHDNLVFLTDAQPETTAESAQAERTRWWDRFGRSLYEHRKPHPNDPDPDRPLRVGYLGGDYRFHSAAITFAPVIRGHSQQIQPYVYSTMPIDLYDYVTQQWMDYLGAAFVGVSRYSPAAVAHIVRDDRIDILVDLSGYTANNRLQTFCAKPAPIQISAWGYATGVGWPAMDVLFADPIVATPAARAAMVERVVDLPCVITYQPRPDLPEVTPLPCLTQAPRFSVFQRAMKLNAATLNVWTRLLQRVPSATLLFKGPDYSPSVRAWILEALGDTASRVTFTGTSDHKAHLLSYEAVDLSLDPWPQTGGISTLESLWMGAPPVTLIGPRIIQRTSASMLKTLGLEEFITENTEDYIERAVELVTTKRDYLAWVRKTVRQTLKDSPIITGYVGQVEAAYRSLWNEWCASQIAPAIPLDDPRLTSQGQYVGW